MRRFGFFAFLAGLLGAALPLVACGGSVVNPGSSDGGPGDSGNVTQGCPFPLVQCASGCVDTRSDPVNCGACGVACVGGSVCLQSQCQGTIGPGSDGGGLGDAGTGLPPDPGGPPGDGTGTVVLAFSKLYYGDTDRNDVQSTSAWSTYGLNIDGKITTKNSTDVCMLAAGASRVTQVDGNGGIDNSFGENILPILITTAGSNFSASANVAIAHGDATPLLSIDKLGAGARYSPLPGTLYRAAPAGSVSWNGGDVRPVDQAAPALAFSGGYMNQRVWVGQPPLGPVLFDLHFDNGTTAPPVPVQHTQLAMVVDASNATASLGVFSGVVATTDFIAWLKQIAGSISTSLCSGSAFDSIAQQINQASDIVLAPDGSVSNPAGQSCNAISLGFGFNATAVKLGPPVTVPPPVNPCP
ncbi:MAG TPA: hypothetical protein VIF15_13295 [Polyangiaceae bacterium]